MRFGLPASFMLHGGLLAWVLLGYAATKPLKQPEPEPVEVAIISEDGLTRLMQGDRNAKQLQAAPAKLAPPSPAEKEIPKAKPPEPAAPPPPPPPPEPAKVEPPPPPPPKVAEPPPPPPRDEIAELALKAEQEAVLEKQRLADAEKKRLEDQAKADKAKADKAKADKAKADKAKADKAKADKAKADKAKADKAKADKAKADALAKKDDFFEDMQKALVDKDKSKRAPQPSGAQVANANAPKGPTAGAPEGRDTKVTASEASLLGSIMKRQVAKCWNINSGADGADKVRVEVEVKLSPDGRITGQPRVVSRGSSPLQVDMANSAMRALVQCEPYDLPKNLYKGGWDHMIVDFDPSRMF